MGLIVEERDRRGLEATPILGKADAEVLAIGRRLLMGERKPAERFRQRLSGGALDFATGAGDEVVSANFLGPKSNFDRLGDAEPGMRVRGDQYTRHTAARQIFAQGGGIRRIVVNEQNAIALAA